MKLNERKVINDIKLLTLDTMLNSDSNIYNSNLELVPTLFTLFAYHLKFDLERKAWCNRDRLVLSSGHNSALLYTMMFYALDDYTIEDLQNYRKIGSGAPVNPEYNLNKRVEVTSGMLGEGIATSVGMAIGEKHLERMFNRKKNKVFDYNVYCICSDGDLMEGVSYEAISLAGNLALDNLILLYNSNGVTTDGEIDKSFDENIKDRFISMNWEVIEVKDGKSVGEISTAIEKAKKSNKSALIIINNEDDNSKNELSKEDIEDLKEKLKASTPFSYNEVERNNLLKFIKDGTEDYYRDWYSEYEMYIANATDKEKDAINLVIENDNISLDIEAVIDTTKIFEDKTMRDINYQILNVIGTFIPSFIGGSSDMLNYTKTYLKGKKEISYDDFSGRNINFGVREHAMGSILNGLSLSGLRVFGSTLLSYADYMKPAIRMSSMMKLPVTYIFTHDSVKAAEDLGVISPVEQIGYLRSTPGLSVYRPCDYKELIGSWTNILREGKPSALILPKGHNETMKYTSAKKVERGGYIISEVKTRLDLIIITSGSEVDLAMKIKDELLKNYIEARVVSMPNLNLFLKQEKDYQQQVLPSGYRRMVIELSNDANWYKLINSKEDFIGIESYSKSGTEEEILSYYELDIPDLVIKIKNSL